MRGTSAAAAFHWYSMQTEELRNWLALMRLKGVGPATLLPALKQGVSASQIVRGQALHIDTKLAGALQDIPWALVDADQRWLESPDNHFIPWNSPLYPKSLRTLSNPPLALYVHGQIDALPPPQIAVVGSRNPTRGGKQNARDFAAHLAGCGITITSGLALGIDSAAHLGALDGGGHTLAITATGLDRVYPASNLELAHRITQSGALISEFPPGTPPRPGHFPRRNRIISGLSLGVLVVEAALKSGSLITARLALEQSREVFAIPGSIHNPLSRGCHQLIREGAKLVENTDDILEELAPILQPYLHSTSSSQIDASDNLHSLDTEYQQLLAAMGHDPVSVDQLSSQTRLPPEIISSMLLLLEMEGRVSSEAGGLFMRL